MKSPAFQKPCRGCGLTKPIDAFGKDRSRPDLLTVRCKVCNNAASRAWQRANPEQRRAIGAAYRSANPERIRASGRAYRAARPEQLRAKQLRDNYGLSPADVARMREAQGNACALCRRAFRRIPHVDHCHSSGRVRALLCGACNIGLGMFQDDPNLLRIAATYIEVKREAQA